MQKVKQYDQMNMQFQLQNNTVFTVYQRLKWLSMSNQIIVLYTFLRQIGIKTQHKFDNTNY
jgi:hypothetical protein